MEEIYKISNKDLEEYANKVKKDEKYGSEGEIINQALKSFPENKDKAIVAMKICLIDLTNSTNLNRNLGKFGGLSKLAKKITEINFDERVKNGDITLVDELAKWTKMEIGKNLFSFISKYCLYHNIHCYNRDDFVIYDSVVSEYIGKYITDEEYEKITGKKLYKNSFKKMKENFEYNEYVSVIDYIIKKNNISVENPHRKLDWFIWYKNKNKKVLEK
jgi:hypothetical protein